MNKETLQKMNTLANGFAAERVQSVLSEIESTLEPKDKPLWNRSLAQKALGKALAIAYSKGYADCAENIGPRRLIF